MPQVEGAYMGQHQKNYIDRVIKTLPADILILEDKIKRRNDTQSNLTETEQNDYANLAFFYATNQLLAAADALQTLHLLSHGSEAEITVNVTQNGVAGLLRQTLESLGWARWLSGESTEFDRQIRGFFYHVEDVKQRSKYYNDLGQQREMEEADKLLEDVINDGVRLEYYNEMTLSDRTGVLEQKPKMNLPKITDICQGVKLSTSIITPEVLAEYPGMKSASWLYRWASGLAHGKHWVNKHEPNADGLSFRTPNYLNMNLMMSAIHDLIDDIQ
jgi:hypothetical protein